MKLHRLITLALGACLCSADTLTAQCTVDFEGFAVTEFDAVVGNTGSLVASGQTFTACQTGELESIQVVIAQHAGAPVQGTLLIGSGNDPGQTASLLTSQPFTFSAAQTYTLPVNATVPVTEGQLYYFAFVPDLDTPGGGIAGFQLALDFEFPGYVRSALPVGSSGPWSWGTGLRQADFDCEVSLLPATAAPVPALSTWALLVLGLGTAGLGARRVRARGGR